MFILRKRYSFQAAHFLPLVPDGHQCGRMHGHSYSVVIEIGSKNLKKGWVIDFADLDRCIKPIIKTLDHQSLNDFIENPTVENLCVYIADNFLASIEDYTYDERDQEIYLLAVEVSETLKTKCRYELKEVI
ncbi:MAG: 6-carboxytetrahydropterin synthase QueD [Flavobacteriaceae bacterium]|nr:6-carboxytetrahydropterin synthase QueD [Flavobacteriaceae bacterium]|tara:strand:+ start:541 stop:933 length:393 start_codon:yes stop_codon:yes gene_type:complete